MQLEMIHNVPQNERFLALVRKIDEYLLRNQTAVRFGQPAVSLDKSPNGDMFIQKKLASGIRIRGTLTEAERLVTLQIFLDPLRFWAWTKTLGPLDVFYMDPFGIEIFYKKKWGISLAQKAISFRDTNEIHEIARIEVREVEGRRRPIRVV
jgi:hypothetical protein